MFGLKEKLIAFMGLIVGFFFIKSKFQAAKIEDLKHENERFEKKDTIQAAMVEAEAEAEQVEIKAIDSINTDDWRSKLRE